jgi:3-hydroxyacyl-CoA dehydrogenase
VRFGCRTRLYDDTPGVAQQAVEWVNMMAEWRNDGRVSADTEERARTLLEPSPDLNSCARGADIAIESVPENVVVKRRVFSDLDRALRLTRHS